MPDPVTLKVANSCLGRGRSTGLFHAKLSRARTDPHPPDKRWCRTSQHVASEQRVSISLLAVGWRIFQQQPASQPTGQRDRRRNAAFSHHPEARTIAVEVLFT
ncbi:predicted protein [Coccidioides posadasii str. Silveira]|uniref:Predicted protein n=1 Tax=Coccidioides posadasii (strain RMSCC 757 / Silveira) TaxID=443226 RepID=E9DF29_COCPS|nr:predicted protein [Coccidioides posadasii str. Silveira]